MLMELSPETRALNRIAAVATQMGIPTDLRNAQRSGRVAIAHARAVERLATEHAYDSVVIVDVVDAWVSALGDSLSDQTVVCAEIPPVCPDAIRLRPVTFYVLVDSSRSVVEEMPTINAWIRDVIPAVRRESEEYPEFQFIIKFIRIGVEARWVNPTPRALDTVHWENFAADTGPDSTMIGQAIRLVASEISAQCRQEWIALLLISDGKASDDLHGALRELLANRYGRHALRVAIAVGRNPDLRSLPRFVSSHELSPYDIGQDPAEIVSSIMSSWSAKVEEIIFDWSDEPDFFVTEDESATSFPASIDDDGVW